MTAGSETGNGLASSLIVSVSFLLEPAEQRPPGRIGEGLQRCGRGRLISIVNH